MAPDLRKPPPADVGQAAMATGTESDRSAGKETDMIDLSAPTNPSVPDDVFRDQAHRVTMGVEYLDSRTPGWWKHIDLRTLDVTSATNCVLGQVYGTYGDGTEGLGIDDETATTLGFITLDEDGYYTDELATRQLSPHWRGVIRQRQETARAALATMILATP